MGMNVIDCRVTNQKQLVPIRLARDQFNLRSFHVEQRFQDFDDGIVGPAVFRRGGDGDFQHAVPFAEHGVFLRAGLCADGNRRPVRMRLNRDRHVTMDRTA